MITEPLIISVIVFLLCYVMIVSEKINRTIVALFGAMLMIWFHILSQAEALQNIDFNTIGLLIGMMIVVGILKRTGVFQYLAIKTARVAKGNPMRIITYFSIITAISSGLLDNVTTILLIVPVSLVIADTLKINPLPFVFAEVMAANIGGASTAIGDPTMIMIASATGYSFLTFILHLLPLMIVIFIFTITTLKLLFRKSLNVGEEERKKISKMDPNMAITDKPLLIKSLAVLFLAIAGFTVADKLGVETASVALLAASILLLISKTEVDDVLMEVEWGTIFFFGGLFVLVGALKATGAIEDVSKALLNLTGNSLPITTVMVIWMSALLSSFLDNVPYVATMIPVVENLSNNIDNIQPVWWALSIGGCLGGGGTIIGASANVVARGILERNQVRFTFMTYLKIAYPIMLISVGISTLYLLIFFV